MKSNEYRIFAAIAAYLAGQATDKERKMVRAWLEESDSNVQKLNYLRKVVYVGPMDRSEETKERIYNTIRARMNEERPRHEPRRFNPLKYVAAASVVALLILGGLWLRPFSTRAPGAPSAEITSPIATTTSVVLSDGSLVTLNAGSTLSYPEKFTGKERRVELNGEAFFEVVDDDKHPFVVAINEVRVTVLGTKFNVKAYEEEHEIVTTLQEGSVRFEHVVAMGDKREDILLKPDQQVTLDKKTGEVQLKEVEAQLYSSWKDGIYYFDNSSLEEIARRLERGFNVDIEILSPVSRTELFSGIFDKEESLEEILGLLTKYRSIAYKISNNKIIIYNEQDAYK